MDERWFLKNSDVLYGLAAEALSFEGLYSVSGSEPWKDNVFKLMRSDPTWSEVERYNRIHTRLKDLNIKSLSVSSEQQTVSFVTYDSGVFGDIYQSIVYSRMPAKSTELTTPEVWSCRELKVHWYMCNGV